MVDSVASDSESSVARTLAIAEKLSLAMGAPAGGASVTLDKDLLMAVWAQLLGNAELLRSLMDNAGAAVNINGQAYACSQALSEALQPILQERMTQAIEAEIKRDLAAG